MEGRLCIRRRSGVSRRRQCLCVICGVCAWRRRQIHAGGFNMFEGGIAS